MTLRLANKLDTARAGEALGRLLNAGDFVALIGDLGAGKTTLTQAIAHGLEVRERVTSPTFTLAQEYGGRVPLFHFDPYRLDSAADLIGIGWDEYGERGGVIVMEWANHVSEILPPERLTLQLEIENEGTEKEFANTVSQPNEVSDDAPRTLAMTAAGERYERLLVHLLAVPEVNILQRENDGESGAA